MSDVSVTVQTTPISIAVTTNPTVQVSATTGLPNLGSWTNILVLRSETGAFYAVSNPSGFLVASDIGGVQGVVISGGSPITGNVAFTGLGNISVSSVGQSVYISGDTSSLYPNTNPSGFVTAAQVGGVRSLQVNNEIPISGDIIISGVNGSAIILSGSNVLVSGNPSPDTGVYLTTGATDLFASTAQTAGFVLANIYDVRFYV